VVEGPKASPKARAKGATKAQPKQAPPVAASEQAPAPVQYSGPFTPVTDIPEARRLTDSVPTVTMERQEIEKRPNDRVSDVLPRLPGVVVSGPPGERKTFGLRGLTPDYTRVEIDGLQLPAGSSSRSVELMNIPSFLLQDVSIIRNPGAENEADGIAGRISLSTLAVPNRSGVEAKGALGRPADFVGGRNAQGSIVAAHRFSESFGAVAGISVDQRRITKLKDFSERTFSGGPGGLGQTTDSIEPKDFTNIDGILQLGWNWGTGTLSVRGLGLGETVESDGQLRDRYRRVTGQFIDRTLNTGTEETRIGSLSTALKQSFGASLDLWLNAAVSGAGFDSTTGERVLNNALAFSSAARETSAIEDRQYDANVKLAWRPGTLIPQEFRLGAAVRRAEKTSDREVYTENAAGVISQTAANRTASRESDYSVAETYTAAFFQDKFTFGRLSLTPGIRVEHVSDDLVGGTGVGNPSYTDVLPSLITAYMLTDTLRFTAGVSRQVNRPKLEEIAPGITRRGQRLFEGNPNLLPARAWSYDVGVNYVTRNVFLAANVFHRDIDNVIEGVEYATNMYRYINAGPGKTSGLELEQRLSGRLLGASWLAPFTLVMNQTYLESEVDDPRTGPRPFSEVPRFASNWGIEWSNRDTGTTFTTSLNYVSPRIIISNDGSGVIRFKEIHPTWFLDAQFQQKLSANVSFYVTGENLLNQKRDEFELTNGTLAREAVIDTGRVFYAGLKAQF
jgi:outer membrane receptor protein involved in Fe transport